MSIDFKGRVAIISGAGHGIGKSYALELARRGCKVVVNDLGGDGFGHGASEQPAHDVVAEIKAEGGDAVAQFGDVSKYETGVDMVKTAIDNYGKLDIVICNAGILRDKAFHNISEDDWDSIFAVHMKGTYNVLHAAWPHLRANNYGRVVITSSTSGVWGNFGQANYGAAKTGMLGLMNVLKQEGAKYNIKINTLMPTAGTRLTATVFTEEQVEALKPEFVTPAVVYMVSEENQDTGMIIAAGVGRFYRAALVRGPVLDAGLEDPKSVEWVADQWSKITSLENAEPMWNARTTQAEFEAAQKK